MNGKPHIKAQLRRKRISNAINSVLALSPYNQSDLATALGVSEGCISMWKRGLRSPQPSLYWRCMGQLERMIGSHQAELALKSPSPLPAGGAIEKARRHDDIDYARIGVGVSVFVLGVIGAFYSITNLL